MLPINNISPKCIVPAKHIEVKTKQAKIVKAVSKAFTLLALFLKAKTSVKLLKLTMVNIALFQYLIK